MTKTSIEVTLDSIELEKQRVIAAGKEGFVSKEYVQGWVQGMNCIDNIIRNQGLLMEQIAQRAEAKKYPNMQYGLPKYYAVMFENLTCEGLRTEVMNRYNKIYNGDFRGICKFYGFDGNANCWNHVKFFKEPVTVLTATEFLALTDNHFNPAQK